MLAWVWRDVRFFFIFFFNFCSLREHASVPHTILANTTQAEKNSVRGTPPRLTGW